MQIVFITLFLTLNLLNASSLEKKQEGFPTLQSLHLNQNHMTYIQKIRKIFMNRLWGEAFDTIKVMGRFSNGEERELTDHVTWKRESDGKESRHISSYFRDKGRFKLNASIGEVVSSRLDLEVKHEDKEEHFLAHRAYMEDRSLRTTRDGSITFKLKYKPKADVTLSMRLEEGDGMKFYYPSSPSTACLFRKGDFTYCHISVRDVDKSSGRAFTIRFDPLESEDPFYDGKEPSNIEIAPEPIVIAPPLLEEIKGAIRGVRIVFRVYSENRKLEYRLVDPPKGMEIVGKSWLNEYGDTELDAVDIAWNIPMDIEETTHTITVEGIDKVSGERGEVRFDIRVPKTREVKTKIENNELIVIEKNSPLYGMKMRGHSGEDISKLKVRTVDYLDVWREHKRKPLHVDKEIEYIVYIVDNLPKQLDIKQPPFMDDFETEREPKGIAINQYISGSFRLNDYWGWAFGDSFLYEGTDGITIPHAYNDDLSSKVFLIMMNVK
jgi:hypothetical protein